MQGKALSWLGSCAVAAGASLLCDSLQRPCSVPLPVGYTARTWATEAERGEARCVQLMLFLSKANWYCQETLCSLSLKSGARCSWLFSQLGSLVASFKILHFCEKSGAYNSFTSACSDAAHIGAAQTCLELRPSWTLLYPFVSPLLALACASNSNTRMMKVLQDSWYYVCAKADHSHPLPYPAHDAGQQGELITLKSLSCNTMWVQLQHLQATRGLLSCMCVIRSLCGGAWKWLAVIFSLISLLSHWKEVYPWGGLFFMYFDTVYFLSEL